MTTLQICYHGNCFDGVMSAAIFSRFYRERVDPQVELRYRGMMHRRGDPYGDDHDAVFDADANAVLDFRYSPSERLSWWCDHHHSAFIEQAHRAHFEADRSGQKHFDPRAPSCTGLLQRWLVGHHGFDGAPFAEHVRWADLIDSASFASPRQAVELAEPALQLMALLESGPAEPLMRQIIEGASGAPIEVVVSQPQVATALRPVLQQHAAAIDAVRAALQVDRGVAFFDLSEGGPPTFNKFIPYYLQDDLRYVVALSQPPDKVKISVGSNPWQRPDPLVNLADLCGRYGGGGHAVVAGISLGGDELPEGRRAAQEIAEYLRRQP